MNKMLIDALQNGELRVAIINQKNQLIDLNIERTSQQKKQGNIYKGKITSIEPSLGAIFVCYDENQRHGFLPFKRISPEYYLCEPKYDASPDQSNSRTNLPEQESAPQTLEAEAAIEDTIKPETSPSPNISTIDSNDDDSESLILDEEGHARRNRSDQRLTPLNLTDLLKIGQELVVQVEKDERGNKGAALTTFISLPGAYAVLMPNSPQAGGVSRRIPSSERELLRDTVKALTIPQGMGLIIRTAGVNKNTTDLQWDLDVLMHYWEAIKEAAIAKPGPYLIHQESDVVIRSIRDHLKETIHEVIVNEKDCYDKAHYYISQVRPDFIHHLKLYNGDLPLFSQFHIEKQIEMAHKRDVRLPSGGSIVIDHTEALISIDINSSRSTKGRGIEETAYHTNLEAATEIARQLRIRDIGGLIVIDFIDMSQPRHQRDVENRLKEAVKIDRARIQIGRISNRFGLLEMSRQRVGQSLRMSSHSQCPHCDGQGIIRTVESQAFTILHSIQENAAKHKHQHFQLQLPIDVATYLINEKRAELSHIEHTHLCHITLIPNPGLQIPTYHMKQSKVNPEASNLHLQASYKLIQKIKNKNKTAIFSNISTEAPAVTPEIPSKLNPHKQSNSPGVFKQLWNKMLGLDENGETPTTQAPHPKNKAGKAKGNAHNMQQSRKKDGPSRQRKENSRKSGKEHRPSSKKSRGKNSNQHENNNRNHRSTPTSPEMMSTNPNAPSNPASQDRQNRSPSRNQNQRRGSRGGQQRNRKPSNPMQNDLASQQIENTIQQMEAYSRSNTQGQGPLIVDAPKQHITGNHHQPPMVNSPKQQPRGNQNQPSAVDARTQKTRGNQNQPSAVDAPKQQPRGNQNQPSAVDAPKQQTSGNQNQSSAVDAPKQQQNSNQNRPLRPMTDQDGSNPTDTK